MGWALMSVKWPLELSCTSGGLTSGSQLCSTHSLMTFACGWRKANILASHTAKLRHTAHAQHQPGYQSPAIIMSGYKIWHHSRGGTYEWLDRNGTKLYTIVVFLWLGGDCNQLGHVIQVRTQLCEKKPNLPMALCLGELYDRFHQALINALGLFLHSCKDALEACASNRIPNAKYTQCKLEVDIPAAHCGLLVTMAMRAGPITQRAVSGAEGSEWLQLAAEILEECSAPAWVAGRELLVCPSHRGVEAGGQWCLCFLVLRPCWPVNLSLPG